MKNRISEFRKSSGLTQSQLAELVGVKRHTIMAYEHGKISPSIDKGYKICKILGRKITEVFIFD